MKRKNKTNKGDHEENYPRYTKEVMVTIDSIQRSLEMNLTINLKYRNFKHKRNV